VRFRGRSFGLTCGLRIQMRHHHFVTGETILADTSKTAHSLLLSLSVFIKTKSKLGSFRKKKHSVGIDNLLRIR